MIKLIDMKIIVLFYTYAKSSFLKKERKNSEKTQSKRCVVVFND